MGTSLRPGSHLQRLAAIDAVRAHLDGPAPDPEVREAFDKHLSGSLPAFVAAFEGHKPLQGKEKETTDLARAGAASLAASLRLVASSILDADGRPDKARVRGMLGGRTVEGTLRAGLRRQVLGISAFIARIDDRVGQQVHPSALAALKDAIGPLAAQVAAREHARMARTTAGRTLGEATARFDHDYGRFVDVVQANAAPEVAGRVLVRFVIKARRKKAAAESAVPADAAPKLKVRAVAVPVPG